MANQIKTSSNRPQNNFVPSFSIARLLLLGWAISFGFGSCQSHFYDQTQPIKDAAWSYDHSIDFEFEIQDTNVLYDIVLEIKHSQDFMYENMYCMLRVLIPNQPERKQQLSLELADKKGIWFGKCSGGTCTIELAFMTNTAFDQVGKYKMIFEQFTRDQTIQGIQSLRLRIDKSTNKKGAVPSQK